ncbi:MAG TPA: putative metal-dependent hydrolase [Gemmataceae bacterium]|nr:putative metal-dependent hydrolase [Gemmataceae bacterium]
MMDSPTTTREPPQYPAGPDVPVANPTPQRRAELITEIEQAPALLRQAVAGLSGAQLDTCYKNWTIRQIVHHVADSHVNAYVRFKLALTEEVPTIKPYQEGRWVELDDERHGDIAVPLALLERLHVSWVRMLRTMTDGQFARTYFHPESGGKVALSTALGSYAWHGRHHTAQILWLRQSRGWDR